MLEGFPVRRVVGFIAGPLGLAVSIVFPAPAGLSPEGWTTAGVAVLMAAFWICECIPFAATALFPLILFPVLGIAPVGVASAGYSHPIIFLFLGGIFIALAMERWNLHRRIALQIVRWMGTRPSSIVAGFLLASAFLSMWINNTATAVMMLPIGVCVIGLLQNTDHLKKAGFGVALLLGIAYGANIGGFVTLIGTAPNAIFAGYVKETFGVEIGFAQWMVFTAPIAVIALACVWVLLTKVCFPLPKDRIENAAELLETEWHKLGRLRWAEGVVAVVFSLTAALWMLRPLLPFPGISDTVIAMSGGLVLFLIPAKRDGSEFVMDWEAARKIPWDVLILIGGGLSLAAAIDSTGLAKFIGEQTIAIGQMPLILALLIVATVILLLTELTSNTATIATFLPVIGSLTLGMGANPVLFAAVATVAASGAFMLPVATPPNAIVFGSGMISVQQMMRAGVLANVALLILLVLFGMVLGPVVFPQIHSP